MTVYTTEIQYIYSYIITNGNYCVGRIQYENVQLLTVLMPNKLKLKLFQNMFWMHLMTTLK